MDQHRLPPKKRNRAEDLHEDVVEISSKQISELGVKKNGPHIPHWRFLLPPDFDCSRLNNRLVSLIRQNTLPISIRDSIESEISMMPISNVPFTECNVIYQKFTSTDSDTIKWIYSPTSCINLSDPNYKNTCQIISVVNCIKDTPLFLEHSRKGIQIAIRHLKTISQDLATYSKESIKHIMQFCSYFETGFVERILYISKLRQMKEFESMSQGSDVLAKEATALEALAHMAQLEIRDVGNQPTDVTGINSIGIAKKRLISGAVRVSPIDSQKIGMEDIFNLYTSAVPQAMEFYKSVIVGGKDIVDFYTEYKARQNSQSTFISTKALNIIMMNKIMYRLYVVVLVRKLIETRGIDYVTQCANDKSIDSARKVKMGVENALVNVLYTKVLGKRELYDSLTSYKGR